MTVPRRVSGALLLVGGAAQAGMIPVGIAFGSVAGKELVWLAVGIVFFVAAAVVWWRRAAHPLAGWFAVAGGLLVLLQALDGAMVLFAERGAEVPLAAAALGYHLAGGVATIAIAHLLGLFPDGRVHRRYEQVLLRALWPLLALPPLAAVATASVMVPPYLTQPAVPNPWQVAALAGLGPALTTLVLVFQGVFLVGVVLLGLRYRRAPRQVRRRVRWLLLPGLLAGFAAAADLATVVVAGTLPRILVDALWWLALTALPVTAALAIVRPYLLDVDLVLRRSLVHGVLWSLIAGVYVAVAAGLGLAAGQWLPVGTAIVLTVAATLVFQPARRRLEVLADRWVFGARTDPGRLVGRLGESLAETFDLDRLLPHIAGTVQQGLGLRWVHVRLAAGPDGPAGPEAHAGEPRDPEETAALTVPIVLGDEVLGQLACGPTRHGGPPDPDDVELVTTLARQAALAVRNVKLTAELAERLRQVGEQADELERSRARLVRAQETERRRIERNIHDGVQQELVALLSHAGRLRSRLDRDPVEAEALLGELQAGLRRVLADLRELARGIHPTLLSDRGLLEAVEALAARSPLPVEVRADPALRGRRFAEEVEGAGYFTVAEALANVLKHAAARRVAVRLACSDGVLELEIGDDGVGFDPDDAGGDGLLNLAERLDALGGRVDVVSGAAGTTLRARLPVGGVGPPSSGRPRAVIAGAADG